MAWQYQTIEADRRLTLTWLQAIASWQMEVPAAADISRAPESVRGYAT
jgi:hypothetical protein